ncbi:MAG TPA: hypothetical protein DCM62_07820 [Bacteroidales bacterium]|nr:hypothetical protein [Bacteroidales bacterium]
MKKIAILLLFVVSLIGCSKESIDPIAKAPQEKELIREIALLVGNAMTDPNVKNEVLGAMAEVDEFNELVSISYMMGSTRNLRENEVDFLAEPNKMKQTRTMFFKQAVSEEFNANKHNYPSLKRELENRVSESAKLKSFNAADPDLFAQVLEGTGFQIYFPYSHIMDHSIPLQTFYVSYDPMTGATTNDALLFETGRDGFTVINEINNDFTFENPVFGVIPIDPCDIPGQPCDFTYLTGYTAEEMAKIISTPPVFPNVPRLITHNFHHAQMTDDRDLITTRIPWIRVNNTKWMGFLASHQKLTFWRAGGKGTVVIAPNGQLTAPGFDHTVGAVRMRQINIKELRWFAMDGDFDAEWKMFENRHSLIVFSNHDISTSASVTAGFKVGLKRDTAGNWVPNVNATLSGTINIKEGRSRFRAISNLERRQVFLTNVGAEPTGEYKLINGVPFNVKSIGIVSYIFQHWHTSLVTTN